MFWKTAHHRRLIVGDVILLVILTLFGFAFHHELTNSAHILATFVPLLVAWLWLAPWFGLFNEATFRSPKRIWWRTAWAWTAVAPLGALLRAIWLSSVVLPIFALVVLGLHMAAYVLWRTAYAWWASSRTA